LAGALRRIVRTPLIYVSVYTEDTPEGSSFAAGERMHELAKVFSLFFVLLFSYK